MRKGMLATENNYANFLCRRQTIYYNIVTPDWKFFLDRGYTGLVDPLIAATPSTLEYTV